MLRVHILPVAQKLKEQARTMEAEEEAYNAEKRRQAGREVGEAETTIQEVIIGWFKWWQCIDWSIQISLCFHWSVQIMEYFGWLIEFMENWATKRKAAGYEKNTKQKILWYRSYSKVAINLKIKG